MIRSLMSLAFVVVALDAGAAGAKKQELLQQMFAAMGITADATQSATFDRKMSEADIKAVIAFFKTPAGRHLVEATQELNQAAMQHLEAAIARSKQKRTVADLQTLAVAVEAYATDENEYPPTSDLDQLAKKVVPTYLRSMVRTDGWGKDYIYISDKRNYRILSAGPDGRLSPDSQQLGVVKGDFGDDLIFENGSFLQPAEQLR